ncbi:MAG: MBL fold metallo-hydrolase [Aureliella sp.]
MQLHCLGTTGYHPSPSRHTACYYLPEASIVLDAGTAVFRLIQHLRREPKKSLDILLSHAHLDHTVGLTFLIDAMAVTDLEEVRIHGEREKIDAVRTHLYHHLLFPVPPEFQFLPFDSSSGTRQIGDTRIEWFPVEHPGGAVGYVLDLPEDSSGTRKKLSYVTDTVSRVENNYLDLIRGSDLLLHECYFADRLEALAIKTGHSWLGAVTEIVRKADCGQTLLIHINPLSEILGEEVDLPSECRETLRMSVAVDEQVVEF